MLTQSWKYQLNDADNIMKSRWTATTQLWKVYGVICDVIILNCIANNMLYLTNDWMSYIAKICLFYVPIKLVYNLL